MIYRKNSRIPKLLFIASDTSEYEFVLINIISDLKMVSVRHFYETNMYYW